MFEKNMLIRRLLRFTWVKITLRLVCASRREAKLGFPTFTFYFSKKNKIKNENILAGTYTIYLDKVF